MSNNFYGEVLFDYLEIFYKHVLTEYAETHLYMDGLKRKVDDGKIVKETYKNFKKYFQSLKKRRAYLEHQIDLYYNSLAEIEVKQAVKRLPISNSQSAGPVSGQASFGLKIEEIMPKIDKNDYLGKVRYLDEKYDEQELQMKYFNENFRCKSFIQSYNVLDS